MVKLMSTLTFLLYTILLSAQTEISIDSVSAYVGKTVKVCSNVAGTFVTKGDRPVTYLNLGADYPNTKLTIVIFQKDLINFPITPSEQYKGENVCVTGEVGVYKERYQIIANKSEQIVSK
jgi:exonuclease VII large subunit